MPLWTHQSPIKTNTTMTEITILRNGKIVYHSIEPLKMTETQIKQDFENYGVKTDGCTVLIQYS